MPLIEAFVRSPVKVTVGVLLVALFGFVALTRMPMQLTPEDMKDLAAWYASQPGLKTVPKK